MVMVVVVIIDKEDNDDENDYDASRMGPQGAPGCSLLYRDQTRIILLRPGLWFWCFIFGSTRTRRHIQHFWIFERVVDLIVLGFLSGTEEYSSAMI